MKHTFILALLSLSFVSVLAQGKYETKATSSSVNRKGYIGLSLGAAIPTGAFASTGDIETSGYATGGLALSLIQFQYQFHDMLAFNASWFGLSNPVDLDAMTTELFAGSGITGIETTMEKPSSMGGLLIGLTLKKSTFPLYARASVGFAGIQNAQITFKQQGTVTIKQSDMATGLGYEFGAGAIFQLGNHFGVLMEATYLGTDARSQGVEIVSGNTIIGQGNFEYSPSVFVLRAGLGYMF